MIAGLALVIGLVVGLVLRPTVPHGLEPYLPIAVVAALDAVFGGIRPAWTASSTRRCSSSRSCRMCGGGADRLPGRKLGVGGQLSTAVVVVLGIRIFGNAAAIRRHVFRA